MLLNVTSAAQSTKPIDLDLLDPIDVIELMIDLRIQFGQIEQQLKDLKPAFYAACATLSTPKIERGRALPLAHAKRVRDTETYPGSMVVCN